MNTTQLEKLIARFVNNQTLSDQQAELLRRHVESNPQCIAQICDDRAVDGLLRLLAAEDERDFVTGCVEKFETGETPLSSAGNLVTRSRPKLEIANDIATNNPSFKPPTDASAEVSDQRFSEVDTKIVPSKYEPGKRRKRNRQAAILTLAASLLALASAAIWISQSGSQRAESDKTGQVKELGSDRNLTKSEMDLPIENRDQNANPAVDLFDSPGEKIAVSKPQNDRSAVVDREEATDLPIEPDNQPDRVEVADATDKPTMEKAAPLSISATADFANLIERDAVWKNAPWRQLPVNADANDSHANGLARIGSGRMELLEGVARIEFDNGVQVYLLGPAIMNVVTEHSVILQRGSFMAELSQDVPEFEIAMKTVTLSSHDGGLVQLAVSDEGVVEAFVDHGEVTLRRNDDPRVGPMRLAQGELNQAIVTPHENERNVPSISLAQGNGTFLGQVGVDDNSLETASPQMFSEVLDQLAGRKESESELQSEFNNLLKEFGGVDRETGNHDGTRSEAHDQSQSNNLDVGNSDARQSSNSTVFQGSLNINGRQSSFDNQQEYQQALKKFVDEIGIKSGVNYDRNPMPKFDLENGFRFEGNVLKFTLPEEFRILRQKMSK